MIAAPLDRIFVNIAAYRDPECQHTLADAFARAAHPGRVFTGTCWQVLATDSGFFDAVPHLPNLRSVVVDAAHSPGLGWARQRAQRLYQGEEWVLQIDSHMRFVDGWDDVLLSLAAQCPSPRPVLTTHPLGYRPPRQLDPPSITRTRALRFSDEMLVVGPETVNLEPPPEGPLPNAFCAGGFAFASADMFAEVPFDPHHYFLGEEALLSARRWTFGWDFFAPPVPVVYHYYGQREPGLKHWDDHREWGQRQQLSKTRLLHLLGARTAEHPGVIADLDYYGLGTARSLDEYQRWCGVNFRTAEIGPAACYVERGPA